MTLTSLGSGFRREMYPAHTHHQRDLAKITWIMLLTSPKDQVLHTHATTLLGGILEVIGTGKT